MQGHQKIECELTLRAGEVVCGLNGRSLVDWQQAGDYGRLIRRPGSIHAKNGHEINFFYSCFNNLKVKYLDFSLTFS